MSAYSGYLFNITSFLVITQLQLQRNEVIALFNLLNRLSESVKFVHEKGSSIEEVIKEQSPPTVQKGVSKPNLKLVFSPVNITLLFSTFTPRKLALSDLPAGLPLRCRSVICSYMHMPAMYRESNMYMLEAVSYEVLLQPYTRQ